MKKAIKAKYLNNHSLSYPSGKPIHWIRFNKESWYLRNANKLTGKYISRLEEVIERSYHILINQIAGNVIQVDNEASFQLQFAYILKTLGELYKYSSNDLFTIELENTFLIKTPFDKSKSKKARVDIILSLGNFSNFSTAAIELKFL